LYTEVGSDEKFMRCYSKRRSKVRNAPKKNRFKKVENEYDDDEMEDNEY